MKVDKTSMRYCLPVEENSGCFRIAEQWRTAELNPIPLTDRWLNYLNSCRSLKKSVEIGGRVYATSVYFATDEGEFEYIIVDNSWMPADVTTTIAQATDNIFHKYLEGLRVSLCYSEGILPDQRAYLWTDYQERACSISPKDGLTKSSNTWRSISSRMRVLVIGTAGAGKTTLLRRIAIGLAEDSASNDAAQVPIYIQLRHWNKGKGVNRLVRQSLAPHVPEAQQRLSDCSKVGKFVFLLDGLDEIPAEDRQDAYIDIRRFVDSHAHCRFVVSSRPNTASVKLRDDFDECDLQRMSTSEMKELSAMHLSKRGKSIGEFWSRLESEPDIFDIGSNPLILTLLLTRYVRDSLSPHFVGEALTAMAEAFTDEWDSVRGICRSRSPSLTPKHKLALLRHLAWELTERGKTEFSDIDCKQIMGGLTGSNDPLETLRELEEHTGLVSRTATNKWHFSKRAVKDYLLALSLSEKRHDTLHVAARPNLNDQAWRYACWTASDASKLIGDMVSGPYDIDNVLASTKALSQNLVLRREIVLGYALSVSSVLDKLLVETTLEFTGQPDSPPAAPSNNSIHTVCTFRSPAQFTGELNCIGELLIALHHARDGVASRELKDRLGHSTVPATRAILSILQMEGVLSAFVEESATHSALILSCKDWRADA